MSWPSPPSHGECNAFEDLFFRSYYCLSRDFCQPACLLAARFTLKTANSHKECNKFADLLCFKDHHYESLCLRHSLIRSLYFIQVYIFIPLIHSAPFLRFSHILLTPIFSWVYHHAEYFSYPWWCRWSAKARHLFLIFNSSCKRPHLNYILLSNVYSFEFP